MKICIGITLVAVLFMSNYAFAQVPFCPCDDLELPDGTTGNDIVEILCPGGVISDGDIYQITPDRVVIGTDFTVVFYDVQGDPANGGECVIGGSGQRSTDLAGVEVSNCRQSLIDRCGLNTNPIPTISEWGMIAMASVLGFIGLIFAARRRKATA